MTNDETTPVIPPKMILLSAARTVDDEYGGPRARCMTIPVTRELAERWFNHMETLRALQKGDTAIASLSLWSPDAIFHEHLPILDTNPHYTDAWKAVVDRREGWLLVPEDAVDMRYAHRTEGDLVNLLGKDIVFEAQDAYSSARFESDWIDLRVLLILLVAR
jgi:hypothetical protein